MRGPPTGYSFSNTCINLYSLLPVSFEEEVQIKHKEQFLQPAKIGSGVSYAAECHMGSRPNMAMHRVLAGKDCFVS